MNSLRKWKLLACQNWKGKLSEEAKEQYKFAEWLRIQTIDNKLNIVWYSISNEYSGSNNKVFGAKLKCLGKVSGTPDMAFHWCTGSGFIEFKSKLGKQTEKQLLFEEWCNSNNVKYRIARSFEQAVSILIEWGIY